MDRNLIDYLPPFLRNVEENKSILTKGDQPEISKLWDDIDGILNDIFVLTATENGIARWEKLLNLTAFDTDTLDYRRMRVMAKLNEQLPFTFRTLKSFLDVVYGTGNYYLKLNNNEYELVIRLYPAATGGIEAISDYLKRVVPANISVNLGYKMISKTVNGFGGYATIYENLRTSNDFKADISSTIENPVKNVRYLQTIHYLETKGAQTNG